MLIIKIEPNLDGYSHQLQEQDWQTENWLGDEWLEVPDELREKVWNCIGCCDLVIDDEELVDVAPKEPPAPDVEPLRTAKLAEINTACEATIHAGIDVETSVGTKHFNASDQDQTNMLAYRAEIMAAVAGMESEVDLIQGVWYKTDGENEEHRYWSVGDFLKITKEIFKFKVEQLTYCDMLKHYVRSLGSADEISSVYYGMDLGGDDR